VVDFFDTLIKGPGRMRAFGIEYEVRAVVYIVCCFAAMKTKSAIFHACFAVIGIHLRAFVFSSSVLHGRVTHYFIFDARQSARNLVSG
jgi:hypothetical protein